MSGNSTIYGINAVVLATAAGLAAYNPGLVRLAHLRLAPLKDTKHCALLAATKPSQLLCATAFTTAFNACQVI